MIIYQTEGPQGVVYCASLAQAKTTARAALKAGIAGPIEIERCEVVKLTRAAIIDILQSSGGEWCADAEIVATVHAKGGK